MQLILGTAQFDNNYGILRANQIDQNSAEFILNLAYQLGIRIIDTSMDYGNAHQFLCENKNVFTIQTGTLFIFANGRMLFAGSSVVTSAKLLAFLLQ